MEAERSTVRRRIIEVGAPKKSAPEEVHPPEKDDHEPGVSIPLEMWPVVKTLVGYGRRSHGLGGLRGARALERVVDSLIPHLAQCPELIDVIVEARNEAQEIRALATPATSGEQED